MVEYHFVRLVVIDDDSSDANGDDKKNNGNEIGVLLDGSTDPLLLPSNLVVDTVTILLILVGNLVVLKGKEWKR